ncbi:hypothetical protein Dda_2674 [Drechslerella dactyloides]|uniref:3-hydroxyisobutyryl-CoA hydrolase n=1 Tax=Drechslerella dactyloides TaxID=74499 RepID=A0AAD6J009_DREDA|nr:hypothetical protein Dda_2674 [Drechslerella dactyloides]
MASGMPGSLSPVNWLEMRRVAGSVLSQGRSRGMLQIFDMRRVDEIKFLPAKPLSTNLTSNDPPRHETTTDEPGGGGGDALDWNNGVQLELVGEAFMPLAARRSMATEASLSSESANDCIKVFESQAPPPITRQELLLTPPPVVATLYKFPTLEPIQFYKYDAKFLHLPLRSDILHRAIVFEGNAHRLGRAKTKWRGEIRKAGRKIRPQKGTGLARLGTRSSPMLRGGAKAHGPKPRDFSTDLPRKIYDLAVRTALSYRYRKGELIIIGEAMQPAYSKTRYMRQVMLANRWGAGNGKTLFITVTRRNNLWCALNMLEHHGRVMLVKDVDVKDLLEAGRVVIEQHALHYLGEMHGALPRRKKPSERRAEKKAAKLAEIAAQEQAAEAVATAGTEAVIEEIASVQSEAAEQVVDAESAEAATEASEEAIAGMPTETTAESPSQIRAEASPAEAHTSPEADVQPAPESTSSTPPPDSDRTTSSSSYPNRRQVRHPNSAIVAVTSPPKTATAAARYLGTDLPTTALRQIHPRRRAVAPGQLDASTRYRAIDPLKPPVQSDPAQDIVWHDTTTALHGTDGPRAHSLGTRERTADIRCYDATAGENWNFECDGTNAKPSGVVTQPEEPDDVLFDSVYGVRTILLNRPAKLNALSGSMAGKILPRLLEWQKSDMANVIIIKGAGDKAFCAGGDVAVLAKQNRTREGQKASLEYFAVEYKLDNLIAKLKKPYVAFMDGITMGGGVGLSMHGHFRIATERTMFSMPETTIGFFPDVGASFFLPRMDGYLGTYLALTSARLKGVQAYYAGVATHYIHSSSLDDVQARLAELVFKDHDDLQLRLELINSTIEEFVTGLPPNQPFILGGETREAIDRCFRYNTVDEIIQALEAENTEWAAETIKTIKGRSPTSVRVTLLEMRYGAQWSINTAFMREYHMARHFMNHDAHPDFVEGVEKQLAKKDAEGNKPQPAWSPPTLEETTDEDALRYLGIDAAAQGLDIIKVEPENDYLHYPHGWIGLPSENGVRLVLEAGEAKTVDQLVEKVVEQWDAKVGVREKLADIVARKIKVNEAGFAEWKKA